MTTKKLTGIDRIKRIEEMMHDLSIPDYMDSPFKFRSKLGLDYVITEMFKVSKKSKTGVSLKGYIDESLNIEELTLPTELIKLLRKGNLFLLTIGRITTGKWMLIMGSNMYH